MAKNCEILTKEIARNRIKSAAPLYTTKVKSQEEAIRRLEEVAKLVKEDYLDEERVRTFADEKVPLSPTVVVEKKYPTNLTEEQEEAGKISAKWGTKIHNVMQNIFDTWSKGKKPKNDGSVNEKDFQQLLGTAKAIKSWVDQKQKAIDPEGKAVYLTELFVASGKMEMTGAIDLLVVFSNGKTVKFDFKTTKSKHWYFSSKGTFQAENIFDSYNKKERHDLQTLLYSEMLEGDYKMDNMEDFIVPIVLRFKKGGKLHGVVSYQEDPSIEGDQYLDFIPTATSKTFDKNLDTLIDQLSSRIKALRDQKKRENKDKIYLLEKQYANLIIKKDLSFVQEILDSTRASFAKLKKSKDYGPESINELRELLDDIKPYQSLEKIYEESIKYHEDKDAMEDLLLDLSKDADMLFEKIDKEKRDITRSFLDASALNEDKELKDQRKLGVMAATFLRYNSIDNPFIKALMKVVNKMTDLAVFHTRQDKEKILDIESAAVKVLGSTSALYKMLINKKTGNLYAKHSQDFWDELEKIKSIKDKKEKGLAYQKFYQLKNKEEFKAYYKQERDKKRNAIRTSILTSGVKMDTPLYTKIFNGRMNSWEKTHNLIDEPTSWADGYLRNRFTTIRPEVDEKYASQEYKVIKATPEVLAYYNMWTEQMEKIRKMLDLNYSSVMNNFIPWFRKDMVDRMEDGVGAYFKELFKDWTGGPREDDLYMMSYADQDGHKKQIPIHGIRPLSNVGGKIDPNEKSFDLTKSLLMFTEMAYQSKFAMNAEAAALSIKELHADEAKNAYLKGMEGQKDWRGRVLKDHIEAFSTVDSLLETAIDTSIYGIYRKELFDPKKDKFIKKLLSWNSKRLLGLSFTPALAGGAAAYVQLIGIAKKELYWSKEQDDAADKLLLNSLISKLKGEKDKASFFNSVMDIFIEADIDKAINKSQSKLKQILDSRSLYLFYRSSDEAVDAKISLAAAQNYGFDDSGNLKQLDHLPEGTKSIYELFEFNEKTEEYSLDNFGKTDEEKAMKMGQFRRVVQDVQYKVKGSMPKGESAAYQQNLIAEAAMQFKSWMPGVVLERFNHLHYNSTVDTVEVGRYTALKEFVKSSFSEEEVSFVEKVADRLVLASHLMVKMINRKHLLSETDSGKKALSASFSHLSAEMKAYFMDGSDNIEDGEAAYRIRLEKEMLAIAQDLRFILGTTIALMLMGTAYGMAGDKDEQELKDLNWTTRQGYKFLRKFALELKFAYNPLELLNLSKGAMPIIGAGLDIKNFITNTFDEGRDWVFGENSPQDKSGFLHYLTLLIYGGRQFRNTVDFLWEVDKRLPN